MIGFTSVEKDFAVPLQLIELVSTAVFLQAYKKPKTTAAIRIFFIKWDFGDDNFFIGSKYDLVLLA
jgi:hypothetical protein